MTRVLVTRSCRLPQFAAAVTFARERHPDAEIVALSHAGHQDALRQAGADMVLELPGTRFSLSRLAPWHWWRLRRHAFDELVLPQVADHPSAYNNLHRLATLVRARTVVVLPADAAPRIASRRAFVRDALIDDTLSGLPAAIDQCLFLAMLAVASVVHLLSRAIRVVTRRRQDTTSRRRVLHVIPSLGMGGAQRQMFEVINSTPVDQDEVEVLVLAHAGAGFATHWLRRDDVRITYLRSYPTLTLMARDVARHCRRGHYDIVHTWLWLANWVGAAGARVAGVPAVVTSVRTLSVNDRSIGYGGWWHRAADVIGSRLADVVTVNAEALADNYAAWALQSRRRIRVVHNGLDPSTLVVDRAHARARLLELTGAPPDAVLVGTVGRLSPEKNHALLLRILERIRHDHPNVHGVIVGDGVRQVDLEAEARTRGLGQTVTFLGQQRDPVVLMAGLDLFVLPSLIEGFPNALLEAVFLGVPAVATRVGGNGDVLGDASLLFDVHSDDEGVAVVDGALRNRLLTITRAEIARTRAHELFTASRTASHWQAVYAASVGTPGRTVLTARPAGSIS